VVLLKKYPTYNVAYLKGEKGVCLHENEGEERRMETRQAIVRMLRALGLERPSASRSRAPFLARALVVLKAA
jgi:hypothetical protein